MEREFGETVQQVMSAFKSEDAPSCGELIAKALRDLEGESPSSTASVVDSVVKPQSSFLFVLDEALVLTKKEGVAKDESLFVSWRRTIREVSSPNWFFLLLDTSPTVSNFLPEKENDPSFRASQTDLFPPFYALPITGPWELTQKCVETCSSFMHTEPALDELSLASYTHNAAETLLRNSRLMYSERATRALGVQGVIDFAVAKLFGIEKNSPNRRIPLLCYLYSLRPSAQNTKDTLICNCSATLMLQSRDKMLVDYEPEPIFGEAAMAELTKTPPFSSILRELSQRVAQGDLGRAYSVGDKGEFVAAVYLLEAMRCAAVQRRAQPSIEFFSTLMPMHYYLSVLAGGRDVLKVFDLFLVPSSLNTRSSTSSPVAKRDTFQHYCWARCLYSMVNFTRFSQAESFITPEMLQSALESRIAFFAPPGEKAIDAIAPADLRTDIDPLPRGEFDAFAAKLKMASADEDIDSTYSDKKDENGRDMAVLAVQVKNLSEHEQLSQVRRWLRAQSLHVLKTTGARFVISVLVFTGPGKFTSAQLNGIVPFSILDCRGDADDTDMRSLYIVINEFVAVEEESRELLRQMSAALNILSVQRKVYDKLDMKEPNPQLDVFFENIDALHAEILQSRVKGPTPKASPVYEECLTDATGDWVAIDFATMSKSKEKGKLIVPSSSIKVKEKSTVKKRNRESAKANKAGEKHNV